MGKGGNSAPGAASSSRVKPPQIKTHKRVGSQIQRVRAPGRLWFDGEGKKLPEEFQGEDCVTAEMRKRFKDVHSRCAFCRAKGKHTILCGSHVTSQSTTMRLFLSASAGPSAAPVSVLPAVGSTPLSTYSETPVESNSATAILDNSGQTTTNDTNDANVVAASGLPALAAEDSVAHDTTTPNVDDTPSIVPNGSNDEEVQFGVDDEEESDDGELDEPDDINEDVGMINSECCDYMDYWWEELQFLITTTASRTPVHCMTLVSPELLRGKFIKYRWSSVAWALAGSCLKLVHPLETHAEYIKTLTCECGQPLERNGYCKGYRVVKSVSGGIDILKLGAFVCRKQCTIATARGQTTVSYNALSPHIQHQLPHFVRAVEYKSSERLSVAAADMYLAKQLSETGTKFASLASAIRHGRTSRAVLDELRRIDYHLFCWKNPSMLSNGLVPAKLEGSAIDYRLVGTCGVRLLKRSVVEMSQLQEPLIQSHLRSNANGTQSLAHDHLMLSGNSAGVNGSSAVLCVCNDVGAPISIRGMASKSIRHAQKLLEEIHSCTPGVKAWFTDDAKKDVGTLKDINKDVVVCEDIFHIEQRLQECVDKRCPHRLLWDQSVHNSLFKFDQSDIDAFVERNGGGDAIREKVKDPSFLKRQRSIRRYARPPDEVIKNLESSLGKFISLGVFKPTSTRKEHLGGKSASTFEVWRTSLDRILQYCHYPGEMVWHVRVNTPKGVGYYTMRGTNAVENLNGRIRQANVELYDGEVAHALLLGVGVRRSLAVMRNVRQVPFLPDLTDLTLSNAMLNAHETCKARGCLGNTTVYFDASVKVLPIEPSRYLSGLRCTFGSSYQAAQELIVQGTVNVGKKRILPPSPARALPKDIETLRQPRFKPFSATLPCEGSLARTMLQTGEYMKRKKDVAEFVVDGHLTEKFYEAIVSSTPDQVVDLSKLAVCWNFQLVVQLLEEEEEDKPTRILNVDVDLDKITYKESVHFSDFLKVYSAGVAKHKLPKELLIACTTTVTTGPPPLEGPLLQASTSDHAVVNEPFPAPARPSFTRKLKLTSSPAGSSGPSIAQLLQTSSSTTPPAAPSTSGNGGECATKKQRTRQTCPECGLIQHSKTSACAFHLFKQNPDNWKRRNTEERGEAQLRCWFEKKQQAAADLALVANQI